MNPKLKMILFGLFMSVVATLDLIHISRKYLSKRSKYSN